MGCLMKSTWNVLILPILLLAFSTAALAEFVGLDLGNGSRTSSLPNSLNNTYDPFYLACEGRVVAVIAADQVDQALEKWRQLPEGRDAVRIGRTSAADKRVILETALGGERFLEELEDDPLPRIC